MPPSVGSGDYPSAVGVAPKLQRPPSRAAEHALYSGVWRLCFVGLGEDGKYPRQVPDTVPDLVLLTALECLRAVAMAFKSATVFAKWCAQGMGGLQHAVPHVASPC